MTLRYGLIGSGMMGQEHIRNLNLLNDCEVIAVADPDQTMRELAIQTASGKARAFTDYRAMLDSDLCDAVIIASPNDSHYEILLNLLDTDLPVLCEKPLATTSAECRQLLARAETRSAPVWVAMEYRYMPPVHRMLTEVEAGTVGRARMIAIREHRFPFLKKVDNWNRFSERSGGTMVEKCCHFWDLMRFALRSDPVRVYASAGVDVNHQDECYDGQIPDMIDNAFVTVDFENGARGMLDLCMFAEGSYWQETVSVTGEKARVDARVPGPARFSPDGKERAAEVEISVRSSKQVTIEQLNTDHRILAAGDHHGSTFYQHQRFRDLLISGQGKPEVTLEDGLWSVLVGEAAEQSARTGEVIKL